MFAIAICKVIFYYLYTQEERPNNDIQSLFQIKSIV